MFSLAAVQFLNVLPSKEQAVYHNTELRLLLRKATWWGWRGEWRGWWREWGEVCALRRTALQHWNSLWASWLSSEVLLGGLLS